MSRAWIGRIAATASVVGLCLVPALRAAPAPSPVTIGGHSYIQINAAWAGQLLLSSYTRAAARIIPWCDTSAAVGVASPDLHHVGLAIWMTTNPRDCVHLPMPSASHEPCAQLFRTADRRYYAIILGSDATICADMTTQVPGGAAAVIYRARPGLPIGTQVVVTCQADVGGTLEDFVMRPAPARYPRSTTAWLVPDRDLVTPSPDAFAALPRCFGLSPRV